jgi:hypothetical protein
VNTTVTLNPPKTHEFWRKRRPERGVWGQPRPQARPFLPYPASFPVFEHLFLRVSCEHRFGFQNQPPLPRRRVPKHSAGVKVDSIQEQSDDMETFRGKEWRLILEP